MHSFGLSDKILSEILALAEKHSIETVTVFGSRARGDFGEKSDIDLAINGGNEDLFCFEIDDAVSTLLKFDVVCLGKPVQDELIEKITAEGVVIYERN